MCTLLVIDEDRIFTKEKEIKKFKENNKYVKENKS
jgi:hypothetical protein